ncbi:3-hydroxyacyl-CoA dehydrogenase NAD-binding domain-containing protein [Streptomyces canus]
MFGTSGRATRRKHILDCGARRSRSQPEGAPYPAASRQGHAVGREQPLKREQPHVRIEQGRSAWFWGPRWPDLLPRANKGKTVTVYDISADALDACREDHKTYAAIYQTDLRATEADTSAAQARLSYTTDLAAAVADADLVIEAVPEVPDIKTAVYTDMSSLLKPSAVIATASARPRTSTAATSRAGRRMECRFLRS